jgi:hypothetical protein
MRDRVVRDIGGPVSMLILRSGPLRAMRGTASIAISGTVVSLVDGCKMVRGHREVKSSLGATLDCHLNSSEGRPGEARRGGED